MEFATILNYPESILPVAFPDFFKKIAKKSNSTFG